MRLKFCLLICLVQIFANTNASEGKYTVIAPGTIHSNDIYTAAVAVHQTEESCQIQVGITGPSYTETKLVDATFADVQQVDFNVPVLEQGDYNLTAEGINCLGDFKNTTLLYYAKFDTTVRIQTDKGLYKPGDDINFRVLFLDKNLKPAVPVDGALIWIEDGRRNRIKEFKDLETINGVYTGKFSISEYPVTGGWQLGVSNGGAYDTQAYFEVDTYVLPLYVVSVEATEAVSVKDGDMQVIVKANYTYGEPVDGKVTVILTLGYYYIFGQGDSGTSNQENQGPPTIIKAGDMVKGKAKIDVNVKEFQPYIENQNYPTSISIVATVEEQFTGIKVNGSAYSTLYPYRYSMFCVSYDTCYNFEVGKEQNVTFQITYVDGSYLNDTTSTITLVYTEVLNKWWYPEPQPGDETTTTTMAPPVSENLEFTFTGNMNETGFVTFLVSLDDLPEYDRYSHYYSLEMQYLDETRDVGTTYQYRPVPPVDPPQGGDDEPMEYFILLDKYSEESKLYLNTPADFTLNSSQPLTYFDYNVIGRGNIIQSGHVDLPDAAKVYNLTLTPEILWAPYFSVYAYYVDEDGEFHYAEQNYYIDFELENQITITADEQVKPGQDVALKIKTQPNSLVGLLAVDQSVLLLRSNNDLYPGEFNYVLGYYSTSTPYQGGYTYYPGTTSGCVTLTNADYYYNYTQPDYSSGGFPQPGGGIFPTTPDSGGPVNAPGTGQEVGAPGGSSGAVPVRQDFSETWLFDNIENTEAEFTFTKKIPDTITSWILTAFSMNPLKGIGVTKEQTKITTFLPFFVSLRLPYSVKRGESISVPALVFNYLNEDLDVQVTLDNSDDEYDFIDFSGEVIAEQTQTKTVHVPANGAAGVAYLLEPKVVGNIMLKVTATSAVAGDAIYKSLKVVPEGITQYANRAYFVSIQKTKKAQVNYSFDLQLPVDVVPDSTHVEVGVMGDILGPVLDNVDNLVRLPMGCGEQTMSALVPNYWVLKYLTNSNRLTPAMETKLLYNMEAGYQNMLKYRHPDGSFSAFGPAGIDEKPRNGSTWLTSYVARSFQQLKNYIDVSDTIIEEALLYVSTKQAKNGTFIENGDYFYDSQRNHIVLTSNVILSLIKNATIASMYEKNLKKGLKYLKANIADADSIHSKAVGTYVLSKARCNGAKKELDELKLVAQTDADRMWWSDTEETVDPNWWFYVNSNDVETTSYILMTLMSYKSTKVNYLLPIIRWLIAQRNSYGGFVSSHDTAVGIMALTEFVEFTNYEPAKMTIDIESVDKTETLVLNEDNDILYQTVEMPPQTKSIEITAQGTGTALVQIAYQYNIFVDEAASFTIETTKIDDGSQPNYFEMSVCVNYVGDGDASNMAVLEFSAPSGYGIDSDSLTAINEIDRVSYTELKNSASLLNVYFDHLYENDEICLIVSANRLYAVANQKPTPIVLYDYYDTNKKATAFYEVDSNLCDICENEEDCSNCV